MKRKAYYKAVWSNRIYPIKYWLWQSIGWRLSFSQPKYPSLIPRKPRDNEWDADPADWSGYYSWKEMEEKVIPAFRRVGNGI